MQLSRIALLTTLFCAFTYSANAGGVSSQIASGESKTGTVSGDQVDNYSFVVKQGQSFVVTIEETGVHNDFFAPGIELVSPSGIVHGQSKPFYTRLTEEFPEEGTWQLHVLRGRGEKTVGGSYKVKLLLPGAAGTALSKGQAYSGSLQRGDVNVYTFTGNVGRTVTLSVSPVAGQKFSPEISVYGPDGRNVGGFSCPSEGCAQDYPITANGTWTVMAWKSDMSDAAGGYRLSVSDKN